MLSAAHEVRAPDYIEPIIGWRIWHVVEVDEGLRLRSPLYRTTWPPREALVAACPKGAQWWPGRRRHAPPNERCGCGISAGLTARQAAAYLSRFFKHGPDVLSRVVGRVALWGEVVECERGWRASHAYPARLYVPAPPASKLSLFRSLRPPALPGEEIALGLAEYGVPVEVVDCATALDLAKALDATTLTAR